MLVRKAVAVRTHWKPNTPTQMEPHSKLVKMKVVNLGCIGANGIEVALDNIVCLVGENNCGKSTILRAYELAVGNKPLSESDIHCHANGSPAFVEIWVHIPPSTANIKEEWKIKDGEWLLVRSKWEWPRAGVAPTRSTWDPEADDYSTEGKAAGVDAVFTSRLPAPFRIGSLESPEDEHKRLLKLIIDPVIAHLDKIMETPDSPVRSKADDLRLAADAELAPFRAVLDTVQTKINRSYKQVFNTGEIGIQLSLGKMGVNLSAALAQSSHVSINEVHGPMRWEQQGTGSQRALFWSMLEVRSELKRAADQKAQKEKQLAKLERELEAKRAKPPKKAALMEAHIAAISDLEKLIGDLKDPEAPDETTEGVVLPGYMLLIDEPETALHPSAIRAAKDYLYSLAAESGWQVMLSTHNPTFIDPTKDHTTIVRLHRQSSELSPNIFRSDKAQFLGDEPEILKNLLAFDGTVAEMFFGPHVLIIEGDTEFAAFSEVMDRYPEDFPVGKRPLLLRARGKWTIPILIRILAQFKVSFSVLHDIDAPKTKNGARSNSAYGANTAIAEAVKEARAQGLHVVHRTSCPNFEQHHAMDLPEKDKPFATWKTIRDRPEVEESVIAMLRQLLQPNTRTSGTPDPLDGANFDSAVRQWAELNAAGIAAYVFDATEEAPEKCDIVIAT